MTLFVKTSTNILDFHLIVAMSSLLVGLCLGTFLNSYGMVRLLLPVYLKMVVLTTIYFTVIIVAAFSSEKVVRSSAYPQTSI